MTTPLFMDFYKPDAATVAERTTANARSRRLARSARTGLADIRLFPGFASKRVRKRTRQNRIVGDSCRTSGIPAEGLSYCFIQ